MVAPPETADVVAVAVVPLRPATAGKPAYLVRAARVPSLGDDLRVAQERILGDALDDRRVLEKVARLVPPQDRAEVEAEAVDVHLHDPIMEAVADEGTHDGMVAVEGIAAARVVLVVALIVVRM